MGEIASFRIYPGLGNYEHNNGRRGIYFTVRIFKTLAELRKAAIEGGTQHKSASYYRNALGVCQTWKETEHLRGKHKYTTRDAGQILLCEKHASPDVVAHECAHAANYWFRRIKSIDLKRPIVVKRQEEELLCYAIGEMTNQVYLGLKRAGI